MIMLDPEPEPLRCWSGRGLREFIGKHNISVADLALRAGLRPSTVSKIMASQLEPSLSTAALIYRECRLDDPSVSFADLFFDSPDVWRDL
jgi:transcriptional regulator with XRE-family HTH domain